MVQRHKAVVWHNQRVAKSRLEQQILKRIGGEIKSIRTIELPPGRPEYPGGAAVGCGREHQERAVVLQHAANILQSSKRVAHLFQRTEQHTRIYGHRQLRGFEGFKLAY